MNCSKETPRQGWPRGHPWQEGFPGRSVSEAWPLTLPRGFCPPVAWPMSRIWAVAHRRLATSVPCWTPWAAMLPAAMTRRLFFCSELRTPHPRAAPVTTWVPWSNPRMPVEMSGKRSHCCHKTRAHSRYKSAAETELDTKTEHGWQKPGRIRSHTEDRSSAWTLRQIL